ncbi:MAG TPA: FAD-binding protein [Geobacteraceae bacterium]
MRCAAAAEIESRNTLGLRSRCADVRLVSDPEEMRDYLMGLGADARRRVDVAGELSNTVLGEELEAPLLLYRDGPVLDIARTGNATTVRAAGSCRFDALVELLCARGIPGLELLSGIPGTVGGAAVQNIAAYGQRFSDRFASARAVDLHSGSTVDLDVKAMDFSYRSSSLKRSGRYTPPMAILDVVLEFPREARPEPIAYRDIVARHAACGRAMDDIAARRKTVLEVREAKGLVVGGKNWLPCAGSFFVSPVVARETALRLARLVRGDAFADGFLSWYAPDAGATRFPAALVMRAGGFMNGDRWGAVGLSPHHILAICGYPGATGSDVVALGLLVRSRIRERFGIALEPEVRLLGRLAYKDIGTFTERNPFVPGSAEPAWALGMGAPGQAPS